MCGGIVNSSGRYWGRDLRESSRDGVWNGMLGELIVRDVGRDG